MPEGLLHANNTSALQGQTLTDFVIASLDKAMVREHGVMTLSAEDSIRVAKLLINPPKPNAALRKAAAWHRKLVAMQ